MDSFPIFLFQKYVIFKWLLFYINFYSSQATAPYIYPSATPIMVIPKVGGSAAVAPVKLYPRYSPNSPACPPPILSESELKQVFLIHGKLDFDSLITNKTF